MGDSSVPVYGKPGIIIGPQMLGGGDANWTGWMFAYGEDGKLAYENGKPVFTRVTKDEYGNFIYASRLLGVTAGIEPDSETVKAAEAAAAAAGGGVFISGNYSATHGGGVANNGLLIVGKDVIKEDPPEDVKGDKTLTKDENAPATTPDRDMQDGEFTFILTDDATGEVISTGTNKGGENPDRDDVVISFPAGYFSHKEPGTYTFTVTEQKKDNDPNTIYDETKYQIVVTITSKKVDLSGVDIGNDTTEFNPDNVCEYETTVVIKKATGVDLEGKTTWEELGENESMSFNNKYTSTETPVIPKPDPKPDPDPDPKPGPDPNPDPGPEPDPDIDVPDPDVPLVAPPEEEIEVPDDDVPLADVPQTGDISAMWYAAALFSACGLAVLALLRKERK